MQKKNIYPQACHQRAPSRTLLHFVKAQESGNAMTKKKKKKLASRAPRVTPSLEAPVLTRFTVKRKDYRLSSSTGPYLGHPARRRCGLVSRGHPQAAQPPPPGGRARPSTRAPSSAPPAGVTRGHSAALPSPSFSIGVRPQAAPRDGQQKAGRWVRG